jgi:hypothetical protein
MSYHIIVIGGLLVLRVAKAQKNRAAPYVLKTAVMDKVLQDTPRGAPRIR